MGYITTKVLFFYQKKVISRGAIFRYVQPGRRYVQKILYPDLGGLSVMAISRSCYTCPEDIISIGCSKRFLSHIY